MGLSPILMFIERGIVAILAGVAILLALVSFRGLVPVTDPVSPIGYLDKISLFFGLHEQSRVIIVSAAKWTTEIYIYTFQKRLKDGAFHISGEQHESVSIGLLDSASPFSPPEVEAKCQSILTSVRGQLGQSLARNTPILVKVASEVNNIAKNDKEVLLKAIDDCLVNSEFLYNEESSVGVLSQQTQVVMQWFALGLLNGGLAGLTHKDTPVLVETTEDDLELTFATVLDTDQFPNNTVKANVKVQVFGNNWDLITVKMADLGMYKSRQLVLTNNDTDNERAYSACVNPVVDRWWDYGGKRYHVRGLYRGVEETKERNGPFAGKRVSRPVANYDVCHGIVLSHVKAKLSSGLESVIKEVKRRKFYARGKLFIKCSERGLTDPFKGGNIRLKAFMDSLKHACKVPNTDQPFACVDMMVAGVILDKVLNLHQGSTLMTPQRVGGMTGDWPVTAALDVYQNGL